MERQLWVQAVDRPSNNAESFAHTELDLLPPQRGPIDLLAAQESFAAAAPKSTLGAGWQRRDVGYCRKPGDLKTLHEIVAGAETGPETGPECQPSVEDETRSGEAASWGGLEVAPAS